MPSVIGVDVGGTKLFAAVVGSDLQVGASVRSEVRGLDDADLVQAIAAAVFELRDEAEVAAVGVGLPALFDEAEQIVFSVQHGLIGAELDFGVPTVLDNDSNCAAYAEWRAGAAQGCSNVVSLSLGTGVGGGLILGGRMYRGAHGMGAELGHIVIDADGPPCFGNCPGRGCLEARASGSALGREGTRLLGRHVTGEEVTQLAFAGDGAALAAVHEVACGLGAGLISLTHAFDPEVIVVGGGVMALGEDLLLGPAREEMMSRLQPPYRDRVRVLPAALGPEAAMMGAALLALDSLSA